MSDAVLVLRQTGYGLKSLSRNPRVLVFTVLFPIILLVMFSSIFAKGGGGRAKVHGANIALDAYFTAGMVAYAIMMACFSSLAIGLTTERESGQLKRLRGTPVPAWTFIAARILRSVVLVVMQTVALLLIARIVFDVRLGAAGVGEVAIFAFLGTAALCSLGIALTAITTTADSASTIAPFTTVILSFISGVFIATNQLPNSLVQIGKVFPLAHLASGLQAAFDQGPVHLSGEDVAVIALWGGIGLIVAARTFRWEPRGGTS